MPTVADVELDDAVVVRPGDTLIIRLASSVTQEQFSRIDEVLQDKLPGVHILAMAAEQLLVYRPDGGED